MKQTMRTIYDKIDKSVLVNASHLSSIPLTQYHYLDISTFTVVGRRIVIFVCRLPVSLGKFGSQVICEICL